MLDRKVKYIRMHNSGEMTWVTPEGRIIELAFADEVRAAYKKGFTIIDYEQDEEVTESEFNWFLQAVTYKTEDYY